MNKSIPEKIVPLRLTRFRVEGLYDDYNHEIPINVDEHITAIIAPNGMGKTICLKLIHSLFSGEWEYFSTVHFDTVRYDFSDGSIIEVTSQPSQNLGEVDMFDDVEQAPQVWGSFVEGGDTDPLRFELDTQIGRKLKMMLRRNHPYMSQVSSNLWIDERDGEELNSAEIIDRFGAEMFHSSSHGQTSPVAEPVRAFLNQINCKLIETQRLIVVPREDDSRRNMRRRIQSSQLAISLKSDSLKSIISGEINRYAALSQTLDRTFPRRVIELGDVELEDDIGDQLIQLDLRRKQLMSVGILESDSEVSLDLPEKKIEKSLARVLSVYVEDNRKKLDSLNELYERVDLFQSLMSQRFKKKKITISKSRGIDVDYNDNHINLTSLSSGEQHQLVLFFELLFEIKPNTLILIDEPEISLHVAWQKAFIQDLTKIIELNKFDVVLATHSPQLIGKRYDDLAVELNGTI